MRRATYITIPQVVKVRKHELDITAFQTELSVAKKKLKLTNTDIADCLEVPKTMVEHWFRKDKYFSIPDEEIWFELKELLHIETDIFDLSITTFEYKIGTYEKSERCYFDWGISPTVTCADEIKVILT